MRWLIPTFASAAMLAGCMSIGNLTEQTPIYTGELSGNYYDLAECTKAQHSKTAPMVRIDLLHDKAQQEATVTWSHDFGAMNAFVFKQLDSAHTRLTAYSAVSNGQGLVKYAEDCQQTRAGR